MFLKIGFFYPHELCWCHCYPTVALSSQSVSTSNQTDNRKRTRKKEPVWVINFILTSIVSIIRPCHSFPHGFPAICHPFRMRNAVVMRRAEETQSFGLGWLSERLCWVAFRSQPTKIHQTSQANQHKSTLKRITRHIYNQFDWCFMGY